MTQSLPVTLEIKSFLAVLYCFLSLRWRLFCLVSPGVLLVLNKACSVGGEIFSLLTHVAAFKHHFLNSNNVIQKQLHHLCHLKTTSQSNLSIHPRESKSEIKVHLELLQRQPALYRHMTWTWKHITWIQEVRSCSLLHLVDWTVSSVDNRECYTAVWPTRADQASLNAHDWASTGGCPWKCVVCFRIPLSYWKTCDWGRNFLLSLKTNFFLTILVLGVAIFSLLLFTSWMNRWSKK